MARGIKTTHAQYEAELLRKEIDHWPLEEYKGYDTAILHECLKGHQTLRAPNNVLRNLACSVCCNTIKATDKTYLNKLISKNIEYRPTEKYINTDTNIEHICNKMHKWKIAPKHILEGRKCPQCAMKTGFYSEAFFRNNPEAGQQPGILYCVILVNKATDERTCIKIGITKGTSYKDVNNRAGHFKGYDTRVQKIVKGNLEEIYYLEQYLHELWSEKKYKSEWKFGGHSELFEIDDEIIKSIPNNV